MILVTIIAFAQNKKQSGADTVKVKYIASKDVINNGPLIETSKSEKLTTKPNASINKKLETAFKGADSSRIVKKKAITPNKNLAKSAQDPNALSLGNFKVSPELYGNYAPYIIEYVENYHKNHGPRMTRMKARNKGYFNMIDKTLRKNGIPTDFHSLAVIESAMNPNATSPVGAVGPWQFMAPTATMLGLKVTDSIDERTDFVKSTVAAARYCKRLNNIFHDWLLVVASYNCGPAPILRAMNKTGGKSFWDIKAYLPKETQNHVMAFIATSVWFDKNSKVLDMGGLPKDAKNVKVNTKAPSDKNKKNPANTKVTAKSPVNKSNTAKATNTKSTSKDLKSDVIKENTKEEKNDDLDIADENEKAVPKAEDPNAPKFLNDEINNVVTLKIRGKYNLEAISDNLGLDLDQLRRWNPGFNEKAYTALSHIFLTIPSTKLDAFLINKEEILSISVKNPHPTTVEFKGTKKEKVKPNNSF
jgi:hypothetical protein